METQIHLFTKKQLLPIYASWNVTPLPEIPEKDNIIEVKFNGKSYFDSARISINERKTIGGEILYKVELIKESKLKDK